MRLATWISKERMSQQQAAEGIGCSTTTISHLCADPPKVWPGRELAIRIRAFTRGEVTPDDFLPPYVPEDGDAAGSADAGHAASGDATHSADAGLPASRGLPLLGQEEDQPREAAE